MLVLTRRVNEKILMPELGVTIVITEIHNGKVRVGISAPPEVNIIREELLPSSKPGPLPAPVPA